MESRDLRFADVSVGESASFDRLITQKDADEFASLSGDTSPLHTSEEFAAQTQFQRPLVHGMLLGAFCSAFVGMYLPGKRCLDLRQDLSFKKPVYVGEMVQVSGTVKNKSAATRVLTIALSITRGEDVVMEGTAFVQMLPD